MILLPPQRTSACLKHTSKHNFNLSWCNYREFPHMIYLTLPKDDSLQVHHLWCEVCVAVIVYNYIESFACFSVNCVCTCAAALVLQRPIFPSDFFSMADLLTWHISLWSRRSWGHFCVLAEGWCSAIPVIRGIFMIYQWIITIVTFFSARNTQFIKETL